MLLRNCNVSKEIHFWLKTHFTIITQEFGQKSTLIYGEEWRKNEVISSQIVKK